MPILPSLAGARGALWRVDRTERFGTRPRTELVYLTAQDPGAARALVAVRPHEPMSRVDSAESLEAVSAGGALTAVLSAARAGRRAFGLHAALDLRGDIHAWQLAPALAVARGHARVVVADEAGMGKTVSAAIAIAECLRESPDRRCLVIAPGHLITQWQHELRVRLSIDATNIDGAAMQRMQQDIPAGMTPWMLSGCLLTPLDFVKQAHVLRALERLHWDLLVIDEAHLACGASERRDAVDLIARRARGVLLLTATPSDGGPDRLRTLLELGAAPGGAPPVWLRHAAADRPRVERVLHVSQNRAQRELHDAVTAYARWLLTSPAATESTGLLASVLIRRAQSSPHAVWLSLQRRAGRLGEEPSSSQLSLFDAEDDGDVIGASSGRSLESEKRRLTELIATAAEAARADARLHALARLVARARETAIVFSCFRDTAVHIAERLSTSASVALIHGALPRAAIEAAVDDFTRGRAGILVATDVAAQGLNLHHRCRWVLHYDMPWRPPAVRQRIGRVDRLGQRRRVHSTVLTDRSAFAIDLAQRLEQFTVRMHGDERAGQRRWDVLAAGESRRLATLRGDLIAGGDADGSGQITAFEITIESASRECLQREVVIVRGDPLQAVDAARRMAARLRSRLRAGLVARGARAIAREREIHDAIVSPARRLLRQHGLFDRRAARAADDDAAAVSRAGAEGRDRTAMYERRSNAAVTRVRTIATFTFRT